MITTADLLRALLLTPAGLDAAGAIRWGLPALLWGPPGIAKSATVEALARRLGLPYEWLSPGHRGEGAFGVVPVPDGGRLTYPSPDWTAPLARGGLVLVDELTSAPPALQPALLGLLHDLRIGSAVLPGACRVIAAANPVDSAAAGYDLPAPMANRCVHLRWGLRLDAWTDWAASPAGLDQPDARGGTAIVFEAAAEARAERERQILEAWPNALGLATARISGYLHARPGQLLMEPKPGSPEASGAWPSPRSWDYARRCLAACQIHGLDEAARDTLLAGCVGEGVSLELGSWLDKADLPDADAVLDGAVSWRPDPARPDVAYAVLAACAAVLRQRTGKPKIKGAQGLLAVLDGVRAPDLLRVGGTAIYGDGEIRRALDRPGSAYNDFAARYQRGAEGAAGQVAP